MSSDLSAIQVYIRQLDMSQETVWAAMDLKVLAEMALGDELED